MLGDKIASKRWSWSTPRKWGVDSFEQSGQCFISLHSHLYVYSEMITVYLLLLKIYQGATVSCRRYDHRRALLWRHLFTEWSGQTRCWSGNMCAVGMQVEWAQHCIQFFDVSSVSPPLRGCRSNALSPPARTLQHQPWDEKKKRQNKQPGELTTCNAHHLFLVYQTRPLFKYWTVTNTQ